MFCHWVFLDPKTKLDTGNGSFMDEGLLGGQFYFNASAQGVKGTMISGSPPVCPSVNKQWHLQETCRDNKEWHVHRDWNVGFYPVNALVAEYHNFGSVHPFSNNSDPKVQGEG